MPGYRRRTYSGYQYRKSSRPQPWRKNTNASNGVLGNDGQQTNVTLVANTNTSSNFSKVVTVSGIKVQMACNFDLAGAGLPVYWCVQYCPNGTVASMTPTVGSQLIGPEQFILASGVFLATVFSPTLKISSRLMRKLSTNDSIVLSIIPADNPGTDPIEYAAMVEYFIK